LCNCALGIQLSRLLGAADEVRAETESLQCVMERPAGFLTRANDDMIDRQHHGLAIFFYMQAGIIDSHVFNAAPSLYATHLERRAVNPSGGLAQTRSGFSGTALK
jgi:hypothetical protein